MEREKEGEVEGEGIWQMVSFVDETLHLRLVILLHLHENSYKEG